MDGRLLLWRDRPDRAPYTLSVDIELAPDGADLLSARRVPVMAWELDGEAWCGRAEGWRVWLYGTPAKSGIQLRFRLAPPATQRPSALRRLDVTVRGFAARSGATEAIGLRVAYCGAFSRSDASRSRVTRIGADARESSWWVGALSGADGSSLVFGAEEAMMFATQVLMNNDGMVARQHLEGMTVAPGESLQLDALWLASADIPPHGLLEQFADRMASAHGAAPRDSPCGWGSWGHWLERIDLGLMRETLLTLEGFASIRSAVRLVQVDDGWSEMLESGRVSASWQPNRRFPSGIAPLAAEIRRTGRECGLWLLPFTVNGGSALELQHPEWLVADADGNPLRVGGGDSFCLDPTHPGAAAWLRDLFARLRDWNVRYVKLDFLRALLCPDPDRAADDFDVVRRYHGARTRVQAYRAGLTLIREVLGADTVIVACSAPAAPGAGLVSTHRVGPDIDPRWAGPVTGVRDAARALISNWFWHGRTWVNDPDYLMVCESENVTRFWITVVAMSGGSVVLSADLTALNPWEERYIAAATPPIGRAARPVDLFAHASEPRVLHLPLERGGECWDMLAVLNWSDMPVQETVELVPLHVETPVHVWDVWRERYRRADGSLSLFIDAHDVALLRLTPLADHPQVVGTDIHWAQGWLELDPPLWDAAHGTLTLRGATSAPRSGTAWVSVPSGWYPLPGLVAEGELLRVPIATGQVSVVRFVPVHSDAGRGRSELP